MTRKNKRFVVQEHTTDIPHRLIHWDFMLESAQLLQTYRLDKGPEAILHSGGVAAKIFDHAHKFLTYQGPVNEGRGSVRIIEAGTYKIIHQEQGLIEMELAGKILNGKFALTHIKDDRWLVSRKN